MGQRGPRKKPAAAHKRAGTYRKDRHAGPELPVAEPPMPKGMTPVARAAWKRIVPELMRAGHLARVDGEALRFLCEAIAEFDTATRAIAEHGAVIKCGTNNKGHETSIENPALRVRREARRIVVQLMKEFGMTASARTGLKPTGDPAMPSELAALLGLNRTNN